MAVSQDEYTVLTPTRVSCVEAKRLIAISNFRERRTAVTSMRVSIELLALFKMHVSRTHL